MFEGHVEHLPFTVRIVRTEEDLRKAVFVRQLAYKRHIPTFGDLELKPEKFDKFANSVVLLAESKATQDPVGTLRIMISETGPLVVSELLNLPASLADRSLAEATRLAVKPGPGSKLIKLSLWKAFHRYCLANQIDTMLLAARRPIDRDYLALGFHDPKEGRVEFPVHHTGGLMHRLMVLDLLETERSWLSAPPRLFEFMFVRRHPEIRIFSSVTSMWARPRGRQAVPGHFEVLGPAAFDLAIV